MRHLAASIVAWGRLASPGVCLRWLPVWLPGPGSNAVAGLPICSLADSVANVPEADTAGLSLRWRLDPLTYFRARNVPQFGTISTRPSSARRRSALMTVLRATP